MTQNERVKEIRKTLGLTLEKFGERIGVTRGSMSNIENGNRNLTEQMTKSICREFSVDYMWLTTGEGEMFIDTDDDFIERIDRIMAGEDEARKNLFKFMLELSDDDIAALDRLMKKAIEFTQNNKEKDQPFLEIVFKKADFKLSSFPVLNISEKKVNAFMKLLFPELLGPIRIFIFSNSRSSA